MRQSLAITKRCSRTCDSQRILLLSALRWSVFRNFITMSMKSAWRGIRRYMEERMSVMRPDSLQSVSILGRSFRTYVYSWIQGRKIGSITLANFSETSSDERLFTKTSWRRMVLNNSLSKIFVEWSI